MFQLNIRDIEQSWEVKHTTGTQKLIRYLDRVFCLQEVHQSAEAACKACRHYLDLGIFNVVVIEQNFQFQIWNMLDDHQVKLLQGSTHSQSEPKIETSPDQSNAKVVNSLVNLMNKRLF